MEKGINIFFGLCSLLGLIATIVVFNTSIVSFKITADSAEVYKQMIEIYKILGVSIIALIVVFLVQAYLHHRRVSLLYKDLAELPQENEVLVDTLNNHLLIIRKMTYNIHDISHYSRYISVILRDANIELRKDKSQLTEKQCQKITNDFESFVGKMLVSVASVMSTVTNDSCAACIKIVKDDKVKTFFRDPLSHRDRSGSDLTRDNKRYVYGISSNCAFDRIKDERVPQMYFVCDDLTKYKDYYNGNNDWDSLYNATIVVPIQADLSGEGKKRKKIHLLGFLCCDNMSGGFESLEIKDYLASIGDMLYNIFVLYDRFYQLSVQKGVLNEKLRSYGDWDPS